MPVGVISVTADFVGLFPSIYLMGMAQKHFEKDLMKEIHLRYLLRIQYGWQILFLKIFFFEFNGEVKQQNQEQVWSQNLHLHVLASSWMKQRQFFKSQELQPFLWLGNYNLFFGTVLTKFLYRLMEKKSPLSFLMN